MTSWTMKKAEQQRIDTFRLWFWRRLLRVPNQSILKEINPEYLFEGLMLKLKLQYFGRVMQRCQLIRKDPGAGKDWSEEEKGMTEDEMVGWYHWLSAPECEQSLGDGEGQGSLACYSPLGHKELDMTEWLNNNKTLNQTGLQVTGNPRRLQW